MGFSNLYKRGGCVVIISSNRYADLPVFITKNLFTNDINLLKKTAAINSSIKNLILTLNGERRFNFGIGTLVYSGLFENQTSITSLERTDFTNSVIRTLARFEPRIKDIDANMTIENQTMTLKVTYKISDSSEIQTINIAI